MSLCALVAKISWKFINWKMSDRSQRKNYKSTRRFSIPIHSMINLKFKKYFKIKKHIQARNNLLLLSSMKMSLTN